MSTRHECPRQAELPMQLWYGAILVAELTNAFPDQGTWFADYTPAVDAAQGPLPTRLAAYIDFCIDWHRRVVNEDEYPDPGEFDAYAYITTSGFWRVTSAGRYEIPVDGAPIFRANEVSWNHPEAAPSRALAAQALWRRITGLA